MFKYDIKYVEKAEHDNLVLSKQMEIGNLHIFLILDTLDQKIADLLLNKIIDFLVEGLREKDIYNSFSDVLEKINNFLKEIIKSEEEENSENINKTSLLIGVLDSAGNLHFSKTWKASSYLVRNLNEISEITDKKSNFESFTFVSSWKLEKWDLVVFSNKRLLNYLAKSDLIDVWEKKNLEKACEWVVNILNGEKTKANISFLTLKFEAKEEEKTENEEWFLNFFFNKTRKSLKKPKKTLVWFYKRIARENKIFKNIFLSLGIFVSIYFLYIIVWTVIDKWSSNSKVEAAKTEIKKVEEYIKIAIKASTEKNKSNFDLNIKKAEKITKNIEKNILKEDVEKLITKISNIKKEFNNVKIFEALEDNVVTKTEEKNVIKILENRDKIFVIWEDKVIWPIIQGKKPTRSIFSEMSKWDKFIDAISVGENILLLTKESKLVKYSRNKKFAYLKVIWQKKWEDAKAIKKFGSNIYLIWKDNQIYKHKFAWWNSYTSWEAYLRKQDVLQIGDIVASWIDWWIYLLKKNFTLVHFLKKWNIVQSVRLDKLPNNFDLEEENSRIDILTPEKSKFVFFYLNNKIWVFKPNSTNYNSIENLTFLWQIEANKFAIKSFVVKRNSEILILNENWVYKTSFWVKEQNDWTLDLVLN